MTEEQADKIIELLNEMATRLAEIESEVSTIRQNCN